MSPFGVSLAAASEDVAANARSRGKHYTSSCKEGIVLMLALPPKPGRGYRPGNCRTAKPGRANMVPDHARTDVMPG